MKKSLKYTILIVLVLPIVVQFQACEKQIMSYEGLEGVYFSVRHGDDHRAESSWPYQPYSTVDFVRLGVDELEFPVQVTISGPVKDYDRIFQVEVNPDSTTAVAGTHYDVPAREWVIPAGEISTAVSIRVFRRPDLQDETKNVGLRLVPTADFALAFPEWDAIPSLNGGMIVEKFDASLHTIRLSDVMLEPAVWSGSIQAGGRESGLLGVFSRRKMEFLETYLGLSYQDFASDETMPMARMMLIATDGAAVLLRLFEAGTPVLEDDGRLMWMGVLPWSSYIGVPYVPGS